MSFTQREARGLIRKAVKRVPEGESIRHLNIMPMMDMMTILLVAFIFQMATSALELKPAPSSCRAPRPMRRCPRRRGRSSSRRPASSSKASRSSRSTTATSIRPRRKAAASASRSRACRTSSRRCVRKRSSRCSGRASIPRRRRLRSCSIIADRTTPYRLLIEVMFSAKQKEAGYKHFRLIVQKNFVGQAAQVTGSRSPR